MLSHPTSDQEVLFLGYSLPQLWDIVSQKQTWVAKNLPHDEMQLEIPLMDFCGSFPQENSSKYFS